MFRFSSFNKTKLGALAFFLALAPTILAFQSWEPVSLPAAPGDLRSVIASPLRPEKILAASSSEIFEEGADGRWKKMGVGFPRGTNIHRILQFEEIPESIFVLTEKGLFKGDLINNRWEKIFSGKNAKEKNILSLAILPGESDHWFVGTEEGLFETDDSGKTWYPFFRFGREAIPLLQFAAGKLFAATRTRFYASDDLDHFDPILSLTSGQATEFLEMEDASDDVESEEGLHASIDFTDLVSGEKLRNPLWLASRKGVFESLDQGKTWRMISSSGLRNREMRRLAYSNKSGKIFAATASGVYSYDDSQARWRELYEGMENTEARDLLILARPEETLVAVTGAGVLRRPILPDDIKPAAMYIPGPQKFSLFRELVRLEPTARDLHAAVMRFNNLRNGKIRRWQKESRLAAFLPHFSVGRDFSKNNNVDVDRGATNTPDEFILGPEDVRKGLSADLSWDLGDLIWSSNQTSIDSREKLMVELRNEFLAEATRVYYERRRLQMEIVFTPAANEFDHLEKLNRLDELTALLDGMSQGYLSKRLEAIYAAHPDLSSLWEYDTQKVPG